MKWNFLKIYQKSEQKNQKTQSAQNRFTQPEKRPKVPVVFRFIYQRLTSRKTQIFSFIFFFYLFMVFYPPRLWSRLFLNFLIVILLEPQTPEWNPLIPKLRSTDLFFDYKEAKLTLRGITWGTIYIFSLFHFRYF